MCFRPILVFKVSLFDQKNLEAFFDALLTAQEIIIEKIFIPGQV